MNRKALGKGINALIPDFEIGAHDISEAHHPGVVELLIDEIVPNPNQPRKTFDDAKLEELVVSIRENGIIQPVVVQRGEEGYELIVGERRWRASKKAGLKKIPVVIREASSTDSLTLAIIENIHRQDLNPIEEGLAYRQLAGEFGLTQEAIAKKVGKDRTSIANYQRLLKLPKGVQEDIIAGRLTMGHARALAGLDSEKNIEILRREIIHKDLNVRQAEKRVNSLNAASGGKKSAKASNKDIFLKNLNVSLERALGTKVEVHPGKKGGKLVISYYSDDDLERICGIVIPKLP